MQDYQERYLNNTKEIAALAGMQDPDASGADAQTGESKARLSRLRADNIAILNECLFPALDCLHGASEAEIADLVEFADCMMDWKINLDCGVYVVIHEALLRLYRARRSREDVIRELYKLGMGLYYQNRLVEGVEAAGADAAHFRNELVFSEAGSYLRFYEELESQDTRGYVVRASANVSLCTRDHTRRIAASGRALRIIQDEHYRSLAPDLPWKAFLRAAHQQMSANRSELARSNLSRSELAMVMESCYEVFKPEESAANQNVRWLWPYYDMEYRCGYATLDTTLQRLETLILQSDADSYDQSSLYGTVQLPIYYGRLIKSNPKLQTDVSRMDFLNRAYRRMLHSLAFYPLEKWEDYAGYLVMLVLTEYYETDGVPSYREVSEMLMKHFTGLLYERSVRTGEIMAVLCDAILADDPSFFDEIPQIGTITEPERKHEMLLAFARDCGLYHDFGLVQMRTERILATRDFFEGEFELYKLHTIAGSNNLRSRASTERFADIALGHHRFYSGAGGYPQEYVRNTSPYRQMTDVAALAAYLVDEKIETDLRELAENGRGRFAPQPLSCLLDAQTAERIVRILRGGKA